MAPTDAERRMSMACKYETSNGRCGLKGCYAYRHKCYTEDMCKCHEPTTNADRIRAMTDDELNDLFHDIYDSGAYDAVSYGCGHQTNSFEWTMDWLQQPPKGE